MILAATLALAAPPEGVDRDDTDRWEAMVDAALDGPSGCWELAGDLTVEMGFLAKASFRQRSRDALTTYRGTWKGTLDAGRWTAFSYRIDEPASEVDDPTDLRVYPVVGEIERSIVDAANERESPEPEGRSVRFGSRRRADRDAKDDEASDDEASATGAVNLVRESMEAWDTNTAISVAQWRDDTREIELIQDTPISDARNAPTFTLKTRIPEGEWVSRMSAVFPRKFTVGSWPFTAKLHDTQFHLVQRRIEEHVFPAAENVSTVGTALGFTLAYEQRLDYRSAKPCE